LLNAARKLRITAALGCAALWLPCTPASSQSTTGSSHSASSPASFQAAANKATAARDAGRLDEAVPLFHKALALNPRWAEGWWSLGTIDYDNDQYQAAAVSFKKVVALNPKHGTAHAMLGLCEFELGQDAEALRNIEASKSLGVETDPQLRQVVLYHEGILLQRSSRFQAASKALSSLCLSGVRSEDLAEIFGMTMLHMSDKTLPVTGSPSGEVVNHIGRGACLSAAKEYEAARREYEFVLQQYPHFPLVHFAYGKFLLEARDRAGAIEAFKQEISEAPDNVLAQLEIAATEYKVDSATGAEYAEQAVKIEPGSPLPHYLLGLLLLDTGDYQGSITHLEIAKKAFPQESKIYWSLGVAYAHAGRQKDAAEARAAFARLNQANNGASPGTAADETPDSVPQIDVMDSAGAAETH